MYESDDELGEDLGLGKGGDQADLDEELQGEIDPDA